MSARARLLLLLLPLAVAGCGRRERPLANAVFPDGGTPARDAGAGPGPIVRLAEGTVTCPPGYTTVFSCGCASFGSCSGDPVLHVCTSGVSTFDCADGIGEIASNDDACGLCPRVSITCPSSGRVVLATSAATGGSYDCDLHGQAQ